MVFSYALIGMAAVASTFVTASPKSLVPLPWDGTGTDLTVETLTKKYQDHILIQRNGGNNGKPSDYVTINDGGRLPAYTDDQSVINIGVDAKAQFLTQTQLIRTELVRNVTANTKGTTFFRMSLMKKDPFIHPFPWQLLFTETHIFEIRVDATKSPPMLIYLNNATWDAKHEVEFVYGTWYNFGIGIKAAASGKGSVLDFYMSEGHADLVLITSHEVSMQFPDFHEFHVGCLAYFDKVVPPMVPGQDIFSYNGVRILDEVSTSSDGSNLNVPTQMDPTGGSSEKLPAKQSPINPPKCA
ncbi:hypothetical protein CCR75_002873 [Bremia lactucae]|uniref:Glycoside hydrolase 131 catalytic N-terminal domain-containing protein n=1 Tax=Bremia lactucae TaxID=4779 RepID=A0A976FMF4_BRELC|nr:hypothetical protein CCR75_002873 [Bremia lactucae]